MKNLKNNATTMSTNTLILMASKTKTTIPNRAKITEASKGGMRSSDEDDYKISNQYENKNRA